MPAPVFYPVEYHYVVIKSYLKTEKEHGKDALEKFETVVKIENTDLKKAYEQLNAEYEQSEEADCIHN